MDRKIKLALLAALGFSTACSTVRNTAKDSKKSDKSATEATQKELHPQIIVMYGVPNPARPGVNDYEIDPVVEQPDDEVDVKKNVNENEKKK